MDVRQVADFKRILVPLDGSLCAETAPRYVKSFVRADTAVVFLRVIEQDGTDGPINESTRRIHEYALCTLGREADLVHLSNTAPELTVEVRDGDPVEQILRAVKVHDIDLIVMTRQGEGRMKHDGLGRVVGQVASRSPVPVLIVYGCVTPRIGAEPEIRRIVAPLDGSDRSTQVLEIVGNLAQQLSVPVALVTALDLASCGSPALAREAAYDQDLYRELFADVEMDARRTLNRTAVDLAQQGTEVTTQLPIGPAAETIAAVVTEGDLLVMTSRRRGGGHQWQIGSVAENVLTSVPVPVLLVPTRPEPEVVVPVADEPISYLPISM